MASPSDDALWGGRKWLDVARGVMNEQDVLDQLDAMARKKADVNKTMHFNNERFSVLWALAACAAHPSLFEKAFSLGAAINTRDTNNPLKAALCGVGNTAKNPHKGSGVICILYSHAIATDVARWKAAAKAVDQFGRTPAEYLLDLEHADLSPFAPLITQQAVRSNNCGFVRRAVETCNINAMRMALRTGADVLDVEIDDTPLPLFVGKRAFPVGPAIKAPEAGKATAFLQGIMELIVEQCVRQFVGCALPLPELNELMRQKAAEICAHAQAHHTVDVPPHPERTYAERLAAANQKSVERMAFLQHEYEQILSAAVQEIRGARLGVLSHATVSRISDSLKAIAERDVSAVRRKIVDLRRGSGSPADAVSALQILRSNLIKVMAMIEKFISEERDTKTHRLFLEAVMVCKDGLAAIIQQMSHASDAASREPDRAGAKLAATLPLMFERFNAARDMTLSDVVGAFACMKDSQFR